MADDDNIIAIGVVVYPANDGTPELYEQAESYEISKEGELTLDSHKDSVMGFATWGRGQWQRVELRYTKKEDNA